MKKFLTAFLLIAVLLFSGCSCSAKPKIAIDTDVANNATHKEYNVYLADYTDSTYKHLYEQKEKYGNISIMGDYIIDIEKVSSENVPKISEEMKTALSGSTIYKLSTKLTLTVNVEKANYNDTDTIESIAYFYSKNLTPLYSKTDSKTSYIALDGEAPKVNKSNVVDEIIYDTNSYLINREKDGKQSESNKIDYEKFTVLDNNALLLAIENTEIADVNKDKSFYVVSSGYGQSQNVKITYKEKIATINVNNQTYNDVKLETFNVVGNASGCMGANNGKAQIVYLANNNIVKYISPLCSNDFNFYSLGALQYDLKA